MRHIILLGLLLVGGCMSTKLEPVVQSCPPLVTYNHGFQAATAKELKAIAGEAPHVAQMITDYGAERRALATCQTAASKASNPLDATGGPMELVPWRQ
jgi:hypothetical protein